MTTPSTARKAGPFTGTGSQSAWPFAFKVFAATDVKVTATDANGAEVALELNTDYTVSINANQETSPGGTVTYLLPAGRKLSIVGDLEYDQPLDLPSGGNYSPTALENQLDRMVMQTQQIAEELTRTPKVPVTSDYPLESLTADLIRLADSADNVDTVATNLADITTVADDLNEPVSEINTVAANIANVNVVGNNIASVNTVAGISANVTSVAGNASNINAVAGNASNITAVAGNASNINTVAGNTTNVNTVATNIASVNTAATNISAIIAAPSEAAAAAASAAAAAAAAAAGMYSGVQDKSANYTVVVADAGDLIRMSTSAGPRTVTLPAVSSVPDGFNVTVVKWSDDVNGVTVARTGTDLINGATSYLLDSQYRSATFVADAETGTWFASGSGSAATSIVVDAFGGNGTAGPYTLSGNPGSKNNTLVNINGVFQLKSSYTLSGTQITFTSAVPLGTAFEVQWSQPLAIGTPADGTVSTPKLADGATTTDKIANDAVVTSKLADAAVTFAKMQGVATARLLGRNTAGAGNIEELTAATVRALLSLVPGTDVQAYDAATAKTNVAQSFSAAQRGTVSALTDGATITPNFATANNFSVTLAGNRTLANPTNLTAGQSGVIVITQDATGSRTLAYGSQWKFASGTAPSLTTTANAVDVLAYYVESATRITARLISDVK